MRDTKDDVHDTLVGRRLTLPGKVKQGQLLGVSDANTTVLVMRDAVAMLAVDGRCNTNDVRKLYETLTPGPDGLRPPADWCARPWLRIATHPLGLAPAGCQLPSSALPALQSALGGATAQDGLTLEGRGPHASVEVGPTQIDFVVQCSLQSSLECCSFPV